MASLFQSNAGAMHNPLLPGGDQSTALPFGYGPGGLPQRAAGPREPSSRTQQPIVTGTGIIALKYKDGIMVAGDTLGAFAAGASLPHSHSWCGSARRWPRGHALHRAWRGALPRIQNTRPPVLRLATLAQA